LRAPSRAHDGIHVALFAAFAERIIDTINIATWLGIGGAFGFLWAQLDPSKDRVVYIETVAVAIFGAFIGGEFVSALFRADPKVTTISIVAVSLSFACSFAALIILRLMRRAVGPMRSGKSKAHR